MSKNIKAQKWLAWNNARAPSLLQNVNQRLLTKSMRWKARMLLTNTQHIAKKQNNRLSIRLSSNQCQTVLCRSMSVMINWHMETESIEFVIRCIWALDLTTASRNHHLATIEEFIIKIPTVIMSKTGRSSKWAQSTTSKIQTWVELSSTKISLGRTPRNTWASTSKICSLGN